MKSGDSVPQTPWDFFALGLHRQGGRTRKPLGRMGPCLLPAKCTATGGCVRSRAPPSDAASIFGLQGIPVLWDARALWSRAADAGFCHPAQRRELLNKVILVLRRSEEMLNEHGLSLDLWPSRTRTDQTVLQFDDRL